MQLDELARNWDQFGELDPMWAILTVPEMAGRKWEKEEFFATGIEQVAHLVHDAEQLGFTLRGKRALDFGCGIGRLTFALGKHYEECVGVDIAPSMIRLANEFNPEPSKYTFVLNHSANLESFPSQSFDLVYSTLVLQHMPPTLAKNYVAEFLRLVRPGGHVAFQMPTQLIKTPRPRKGLRSRLRDNLPAPWLDAYRQLRYGSAHSSPNTLLPNSPNMEMHGVPLNEMKAWVVSCAGKIQAVQETTNDRIGWHYAFYWIARV